MSGFQRQIAERKGGSLLCWGMVMLLCLPLITNCQGPGTTQATVASTGTNPQGSPLQPTTASVQDNTTKAATNTSSASGTQASSNASTAATAPSTNATTASTSPNTTAATATNTSAGPRSETTGVTSLPTTDAVKDNSTMEPPTTKAEPPAVPAYYDSCPSGLPCDQLSADCLNCSFDYSCVYGKEYNTTCTLNDGLDCIGSLPLEKTYQCRYCYQTETWQQSCTPANNCQVNACPKQYVLVNCTVEEDLFCLGSRTFHRRKRCNWTSGFKWTTALLLSITLGGFGADRFYLGYWQSGLGKLFSFGGAGVWTLIDVLLIAVGYITPSDGSHYIY